MTGRFLTVDFLTDPFDGRRVRVAALGEVNGTRLIEHADAGQLHLSPWHVRMVRDALADLSLARSLDRPDGLGPQFEVSEPRPLPPTADLQTWLREQLAASARVDVQDVPQADDLDRVADVVEARARGRMFDDVTPRQWAYYRRAAKILGLIDEITEEPTPVGQRVRELRDAARAAVLAEQFRASRCGAAWLGWSGVTDVARLAAGTAVRFLEERVPTMSEATRKRRAVTLEKWRTGLAVATPLPVQIDV